MVVFIISLVSILTFIYLTFIIINIKHIILLITNALWFLLYTLDLFIFNKIFINNTVFIGYIISIFLLLVGLAFVILMKKNINLDNKIINSRYKGSFIILNENLKIIKISEDLKKCFGIPRFFIYHKFFKVVSKNIRISKYNNNDTTNENYKYSLYETLEREIENDGEISFYDVNGENVVYNYKNIIIKISKTKKYLALVGSLENNNNLYLIEKELKESSKHLDDLENKFLSIFEISSLYLFSIDCVNQTIWYSDSLKQLLNKEKNNEGVADYRKLLERNDLIKVNNVIEKLKTKNEIYTVTYRLCLDNVFFWFKETGKLLLENKNNSSIIGVITKIPTKHFSSSELEILDELETYNELLVNLNSLVKERKFFNLVTVKILNLKEINNLTSRDIGNLCLASFIDKIQKAFSKNIYRISGTTFSFFITNASITNGLKQSIYNNPNFFDIKVNYGSVDTVLNVAAGISVFPSDTSSVEDIYSYSIFALNIAKNSNYIKKVCYYGDIK
jgi:GGDEF domain-containing protein